ncbi:MAG TPA: UDP-N-acetylglucosamine 1-carboxyvinyltransferase [Patescibacteria group bacterium]|jgi:UDP-N-acetylglucosamine 1-carboxyvinyltransferase
MSKFVIDGPTKLNGTVRVNGSKNAAPKLLAATLLAREPVTLTNVPDIADVTSLIEILEAFGMRVKRNGKTVRLDPTKLRSAAVPDRLARRLRSAAVVLGPALARFGKVSMRHPGGDIIGKRPLDVHLKGFVRLGAKVTKDDLQYRLAARRLRGAEIFLEEASVTATENLIMAASLAKGTTVIHNAASELHVKDLADFLNEMGARISGAGTNLVTIEGVEALSGGSHRVRPDEIEAGTLAIAAAITGGKVRIEGADPRNFGMILIKLKEAGVRFTAEEDAITVTGPHRLKATDIKTETWPGFPTDLTSPFTVLMTQAKGMSLIHDHMYEGRFFYTDKMATMGAEITMADPHRIIVFGPTPLMGRELESPDIRAGITMVIAGLAAQGRTVIDHVEHIDRAYERIDQRLRALGARIRRVRS